MCWMLVGPPKRDHCQRANTPVSLTAVRAPEPSFHGAERTSRLPVHDKCGKGLSACAAGELITEVTMIRSWDAHERVSVRRVG
jgi:hypothetical protein